LLQTTSHATGVAGVETQTLPERIVLDGDSANDGKLQYLCSTEPQPCTARMDRAH